MKIQEKDAIDLLLRDRSIVMDLFKIFEGLGAVAKGAKKEIADAICHEINVYIHIEEEIFYPEIGKVVVDEDFLQQAQRDNANIKELIAQIQTTSADDYLHEVKMQALLEKMERRLNREKQVFAKVRRLGIDLLQLGQEMQERKLEIKSADLVI